VASSAGTTILESLGAALDGFTGRYRELAAADDFAAYLKAKREGADEETLTEPVLRAIIEHVLGFPQDAYFEQLGRSGQKPDFLPMDLIAHPFVLDAKSSTEDLGRHEPQIRRYMRQRDLDFGVLFNLRELRVYRKSATGHDPQLSFAVFPLWEAATAAAIPGPEVEPFDRFCELFRHRLLTIDEKVKFIREQPPWPARLAHEPELAVDVDALVERLRRLSRVLSDDAEARVDELEADLRMRPAQRRRLVDELKLLALDLEPGIDLDALPVEPQGWWTGDGLVARAWRQYLLRVAYLALTRILLYRAWEDVDFAPSFLHDGGFDDAYERLGRSLERVLREAFREGADRYRWLFGGDTNYDWYRPRDPALVEVIYSLAPIPLGKLDADVLGGLYVSYVDEIDRDRLGQFFTPRPVVRFMLDRAGFTGDSVFAIEGDTRRPLRVLDFATGSGGFVVETARRIIDEGGLDLRRPDDVYDGLEAVARGIVGGEISPFPYYLSEVNLLLQVSRLLGQLSLLHREPPRFVLGLLHVDTLAAKSAPDASLEGLDPHLRADRGELVPDERLGVVPLDAEKLETYRELKRDASFDLVVGNPPYVAEANNKVLFKQLRAIPAWKGIYRGKTDYLYYFLWLAVEKLKPGGRLAVITPAGWMNAGNADFLREKLTTELRLDELFLFGSYRLFADEQGPAPTPIVESAILIATKIEPPPGHALRVVALEEESDLLRGALLAELTRRAAGAPGRADGIHVHDVAQKELRPERPWPVKFSATDVPTRVVVHLDAVAETLGLERLDRSWKVFQGVQTGADAYTRRIDRRLSATDRAALEGAGVRLGDSILELPTGAENQPPWCDHPELLARAPEPRALLYGAIDDSDYVSLVMLRRPEPPRNVLEYLERFRPVLATRAEIQRNSKRRWWETAWPRGAADLAAPKVIALYRTDRGRFALDEEGDWQPSIKTTVIVGREPAAPVAYLCGVLNSELLDLWYAVRGKTPWHVRRNYEPKRMNEMPYRRPNGDDRAERVGELVRAIAANRRALLPHRAVIRDLTRIVKDPWRVGPVEVDRAALVAELPPSETISVRLDPALCVHVTGKVGKLHCESPTVLTGRNARVEGAPERLDLLEQVLGGRPPADLLGLLLPKDAGAFAALAESRRSQIESLLDEGRKIVEEVERLVCALYDVSADLTEEVVQHAVRRAAGAPGVDSDE
jgi:hypothetical protein